MRDRGPKSSVRIVATANFYGEGRIGHDVVMIHNNKNHIPRNSRDRFPVCSGKVMTFARFVEEHNSGNIQSLGKGKALAKGDFNI